MTEEWRQCLRHNNYLVSNLGRIKNVSKDNILNARPSPQGRLVVGLWINKRSEMLTAALLVLEAFVPRPNGGVVGYKDGNRSNIKLENLFWTTKRELLIQAHKKFKNWPLPKRIQEEKEVCEEHCLTKFHSFIEKTNNIPKPIELCPEPPIGADEAHRTLKSAWDVYIGIMGGACLDHGAEDKKRTWSRGNIDAFSRSTDTRTEM